MADQRWDKMVRGLAKTAVMSADELSEKKGENDLWVKIKRNGERLDGCSGHDFEPDLNWRDWKPNKTVHCQRCGGDMKMHDAMTYLRGFAHGSGRDFKAITETVWPPGAA